MGSVFHGWRRKFGLVTLLLAPFFTGGWIRSLTMTDFLFLPTGNESFGNDTTDAIWSANSSLVWGKFFQSIWTDQFHRSIEWGTYSPLGTHGLGVSPFFHDSDTQWQWHFLGFGVAISRSSQMNPIWVIPYWSIVLPLIAASILLLLKPNNGHSFPIESRRYSVTDVATSK